MTDIAEATRPSRRTVAKGAAWAVPAVVALGVAPEAAASEPCVPTFSFGGHSCKCPGQSTDQSWGYYLQICVSLDAGCTPTGGGSTPTMVYVWDVESNSKPLTGLPSNPTPIPVGGCTSGYLLLHSSSSASKVHFQYSFDADGTNKAWSDFIDAPPDCATGAGGECLAPTP